MTKLTADTITDEQIEALRAEALKAGDGEMVDACDLALQDRRNGRFDAGQVKATDACVKAINAARAQED